MTTPPRPALAIPASLAAGLIVGWLTFVLQGILPDAFNQLANSGAVWCVIGFAAGAVGTIGRELGRRGMLAAALFGAVALFGEVIGYYGSTTLFLGDDVSAAALRGPAVWLVVACVAGPVFGIAGLAYRAGRGRVRHLGMGALGAVFLAEGLYLAIVLGYWAEAAILGTLGLLVPVVLGRSWSERLRGLGALVPLIVVGALAELGVYLLTRAAFR
ncbi:hypothetical protein F4553_001392 [Allocatelliglobosispora scoriae]|uniref:Uncharacterized protein n=1 Tax=Allocatelliglobosispora scoriae TaxID=643052 RepID=A0A841BM15_9ACTN|nr:DUF6518 family protein [Allocatelliglobosispora scoriae]MBB5868013.1 hypothetical protein [Allocatelliglobosispora scoriae]